MVDLPFCIHSRQAAAAQADRLFEKARSANDFMGHPLHRIRMRSSLARESKCRAATKVKGWARLRGMCLTQPEPVRKGGGYLR